VITELRVTIGIGIIVTIFFPEKPQGNARAFQFFGNIFKLTKQGAVALISRLSGAFQDGDEGLIVHLGDVLIGKSCRAYILQVLRNDRS